MRALVESHAFVVEGEQIKVTVSIGVAELRKGMDVKSFYKAADEMLYEAKRTGRNRVCG
jgi:diguanylate cyclase (GGDEF)-like protein